MTSFAQDLNSNTHKNATTETTLLASDIQLQLDALAARNLPATENTIAKNNLQQALQFIDQREGYQRKLKKLNSDINEAPDLIKKYRAQFEKLSTTEKNTPTDQIKLMSDAEIALRFTEQTSLLSAWRNELVEIDKNLLQAQTRPEQTQIKLTALEQRLQTLLTNAEGGNLTEEERLNNQAEQQAITAQTSLLRQELNSNVLLETAAIRKKILEQQIERNNADIQAFQTIIEERRLIATEQTIKDAAQTSTEMPENDLLEEEKNKNKKLAEYLRKSTVAINEYTQTSNSVNTQLETIKRIEGTLLQQIKALIGSTSLFELLYQQKRMLPTGVKNADKLTEDLGQLRLHQFYLSQKRNEFADPNTYVSTFLLQHPSDEATTQSLLELAKKREELYSALQNNLSQLVNLTVNLQIAQKQLETKTKEVSRTIEEQMFWTPSNPPISLDWFKKKSSQLTDEIKSTITYHRLTDIAKALIERPWIFAPLGLLIFALLFKRKNIHNAINTINTTIGNVKKDKQSNTLMVLLFDILLALPVALTFALAGVALIINEQEANLSYGMALLEVALGWLVFNTTYLVLSKENIAIKHFGFAPDVAKLLRKRVLQLGVLILIMMLIMTISNGQLSSISHNGIYIIATLVCYPLLSIHLVKTLLAYKTYRHFNFLSQVFIVVLILTPIALMIATMAGYYYTAIKITIRLINTFYIALFCTLLDGMITRWLKVAARRLSYQRIKEKRQTQIQLREQEQKDTSDLTPPFIEEPALDVETINQQSLKVMRLLLLGLMVFALYFIWADVLVVFNYLNRITLYHYVDAENKLVALSLIGFIAAIIVFFAMILLVRNLPGALEILILSRVRLSTGVSYAITTLLSYVIIGLGVFTSLGILGVSWGKLQWLVAALSVGLGFGLQEIFANFVSGIIVLFERPIRIGDRITIGGVTGTVSRINIRATQILDTDNKDIIIPNKTFVTGQLINWTLTNTVTRITLQIGVAYHSDIDKVKQLLLEIAAQNPRVIKDPGPSVNFVNFTSDALELSLSMLVNEITDRASATDEINSKILNVFAKENIEIPFHQIDVTLKNNQGQELHLT